MGLRGREGGNLGQDDKEDYRGESEIGSITVNLRMGTPRSCAIHGGELYTEA